MIKKKFESTLNLYAGSTTSRFPASTNALGQVYKLSDTQMTALIVPGLLNNGKNRHKVVFKIPFDSSAFRRMVNVRLTQVRPWLLGAKVKADTSNETVLVVRVTHMGDEIMLDSPRKLHEFSHEPVNFTIRYNCAKVTDLDTSNYQAVLSEQNIQSNYGYTGGAGGAPLPTSIAAIGPFATWQIEILEDDNEGLDLYGLSQVVIEFYGRDQYQMNPGTTIVYFITSSIAP